MTSENEALRLIVARAKADGEAVTFGPRGRLVQGQLDRLLDHDEAWGRLMDMLPDGWDCEGAPEAAIAADLAELPRVQAELAGARHDLAVCAGIAQRVREWIEGNGDWSGPELTPHAALRVIEDAVQYHATDSVGDAKEGA